MTFIPHTSIKRGPHKINANAIPCKKNSAVIRLMERLPYIDRFEVLETDWLFGGEFVDYRLESEIAEVCDPVRGRYPYHAHPYAIPLTDYGSGGWNADWTWVLDYNLATHRARIFDGEDWIQNGPNGPLAELGRNHLSLLERESILHHRQLWHWTDEHESWPTWFDSSVFLKTLRDSLQSAAISPWETSNREDGWGADGSTVTKLLLKNGWPNSFDSDQFNADFIRARQAPSQYGDAQDVHERLEEIKETRWYKDMVESGEVIGPDSHLIMLQKQIAQARDEQARWSLKWLLQKTKWDNEQKQDELLNLRQQLHQLCPMGRCYDPKDIILWEFRNVEKEYMDAKYGPDALSKCEEHINQFAKWAAPDSDRLKNCIAQRDREKHWLSLAYSQSKVEALDYCAKANKTLLLSLTPKNRATTTIAQLEEGVVGMESRLSEMAAWKTNIPEQAINAIDEFQKEYNYQADYRLAKVKRIEWIKEQLAEGNEERVWRCFEHHECEGVE